MCTPSLKKLRRRLGSNVARSWSKFLFLALVWSANARAEPAVLHLVMGIDPPDMNSVRSVDPISRMLLGHIMEGLTRYGPNGELVPGIAGRWEVVGNRVTFELRRDAVWNDGTPVRARDFVFAWRQAIDRTVLSPYASIFYPIKNARAIHAGKLPGTELAVSAPDDWTLEVTLESPCAHFMGLTALPTYLPLQEQFYISRGTNYGKDAADLSTNGPFLLSRWEHDLSLVLDKNPRYWDAGRVQLDRIEIPFFTTDQNTAYNLFIAGEIDFVGIGREHLARAQADRLTMRAFRVGSVDYLALNQGQGHPTRNYDLRKALQLVVDPTEYIARVVGVPGTRPAVSVIASWVPGATGPFRTEYPIQTPRPNLQEAQRHVALARQALGDPLPVLSWLTEDNADARRQAEYFQQLYKLQLGLHVAIERPGSQQYYEKVSRGDFDILATNWGPDFADAMTFADLFTSWNGSNLFHHRDSVYDGLIQQAAIEPDRRIRSNLFHRAERALLDQVALVPLAEPVSIYAQRPRLVGVVRRVVGPDPDFTWASFHD
jgi:oligopeptide transport system substrate-binding protein